HMPVARVSSMPAALKTLKAAGVKLYGFEASKGTSIWKSDLTGPVALVLGGENKGIRPHIYIELDGVIHMPLKGSIGSLNVSATAAIALFEAVRQRDKQGK
ncbi:MAG: 23S rRNA (guanosine(2251)-2'-O)-methyltransferase RlmB, partial [Fibrobacteres bacterium]|nr:23S rRNA (guanosine(2251)-2'-O)-methyltransferase RlmB [Fibrobacterota bacterium]